MQNYIDEKFKDLPPEETVKLIQTILDSLGIEVEEIWSDSGVENCYSLNLRVKDGYTASNGKGVTKALARASAYGEFIERLQQGLHYYKLQSVVKDPDMNIHTFAPDGKYMTTQELIDNGEWMDYLIQSYGASLSRKKIAHLCKVYASTVDDRILTLPYYSIFEDKYVYMPASFVDQIYNSNGCCAGNTMEEALIHAISEIFERKCKLELLTKGLIAPRIPDKLLSEFPIVTHILDQIKKTGNYDISIFDISNGNGFPVVASRIINKKSHSYIINGAADPVLEIAVQRSLTELFQGRNIEKMNSRHSSMIIKNVNDVPLSTNAWNSLESSNGLYTADFFADELHPVPPLSKFDDNQNKSNKELLNYELSLCKQLGKPVYIRNYSYLGFISYKIIIPGYSETAWPQILDSVNEYAFGNDLRDTLLDIKSANNAQLTMLLMYRNILSGKVGKVNNFSRISGIPIIGEMNKILPSVTYAYAAYRLERFNEARKYISLLRNTNLSNESLSAYLSCVDMYLDLLIKSLPEDIIRSIIFKFNYNEYAEQLYKHLDCGETPFESLLIKCDLNSCNDCKFNKMCSYQKEKHLIAKVGTEYKKFIDGQNKEHFPRI